MTWTKENIFEPSGCFTREAFEALVNNQLPAEMKILAEQHLESCPFCSDALEGFSAHAQGTTFASLMDKADEGFTNIIAKNQHKSVRKRTLWISVSAAASILMLVGLFLLINQPKTKIQVAQSIAKDSVSIEKPIAKNKEKAEAPQKEKQKVTEPKAVTAKSVKNEVRFTSPVVSEELASEAVVQNEMKEQIKPNAPASEPTKNFEKAVVRDELKLEDFKEKEADKTLAPSKTYGRATGSPALKKVSGAVSEQVFSFVEQTPEFPGGNEALSKFLSENLQYPKTATEMGISGRVYVQFMVDKYGKIGNIKILRGIGGGCDEEALRVVKLMPNWKPGKQGGAPVSTYFTLPIVFSLQK